VIKESKLLNIDLRIALLCLFILASCSNEQKNSHHLASLQSSKKNIGKHFIADTNFILIGDSICVSLNGTGYCVSSNNNGIIGKSYKGILEVDPNGIVYKKQAVLFNDYVLFSTYEDLGQGYRGYLYAFRKSDGVLANEPELKRNYVYSSAGIFIIDNKTNKLFAINRPQWYDKKQLLITTVSMFSLESNKFKNNLNVYAEGTLTETDRSIADFFWKSLSDNAKRAQLLPDDWSKTIGK